MLDKNYLTSTESECTIFDWHIVNIAGHIVNAAGMWILVSSRNYRLHSN